MNCLMTWRCAVTARTRAAAIPAASLRGSPRGRLWNSAHICKEGACCTRPQGRVASGIKQEVTRTSALMAKSGSVKPEGGRVRVA